MGKVLFFIVVAFLAVASGQKNSSVLKCYFCESLVSPECEKRPNDVLQVSCDELQYDHVSRSGGGRAQNKHLAEVFKRESSRSVNNNDIDEYRCIAITITENDDRNFIRTCAPLKRNVANACDFIKEQIGTNVKVKGCSECQRDFCNSSLSLNTGMCIQLISAIFVWFLAKF